MISASRSASSPASGSCSRTPSRSVPRGRGRAPARRGRPRSLESASRACSAAVRSVSANPSRASSAASSASSPGSGSTASTSLEPEAQQVGLAGPLAGGGDHLVELALGGVEPGVQVGVASPAARPASRRRRSGRAPRAGRAGLQQPVLVGLAVHGDQRLGDLGERRRPAPRRRRRTPASGPRRRRCGPARTRSSSTSPPSSSTAAANAGQVRRRCTTPSTRAVCAPVRTAPVSARPPSSSPSAVTTMVLPAPVSPVITVRPGPSSRVEDVDHARASGSGSPQASVVDPRGQAVAGGRSAPRQPSTGRPNFATSRSVNGASCSRTSRTGAAPRRTSIRAPGGRSTVRRPSHHSTPAPSVLREHLDGEHRGRRHHHRAGEQGVGADRHHQQRLDPGPDDRAAGAEVVGGGAGRGRADDAVAAPARQRAAVDLDDAPRASARGRPSRRSPR